LVGSTLRIRSAITVKLLSMKLSLRWERGTLGGHCWQPSWPICLTLMPLGWAKP
jgi:hypothetical protein